MTFGKTSILTFYFYSFYLHSSPNKILSYKRHTFRMWHQEHSDTVRTCTCKKCFIRALARLGKTLETNHKEVMHQIDIAILDILHNTEDLYIIPDIMDISQCGSPDYSPDTRYCTGILQIPRSSWTQYHQDIWDEYIDSREMEIIALMK